MHNHQFTSIMTPAASAGVLSYTLQTTNPIRTQQDINGAYYPIGYPDCSVNEWGIFNNPGTFLVNNNILLNLSVTGINANDSEVSIAQTIWNQLSAELTIANVVYSGLPVFSSQVPAATFRVDQTDHVVALFSESLFTLTLVANTTGAIINTSSLPSLATVGIVNLFAPVAGVVLTDINGVTLTSQQIAILIGNMSAQLCTILNNKIVVTSYVCAETGFWQNALRLRAGLPVLYFDPVRIKRPYSVSLFGTLVGDSTSVVWALNPYTGYLRYIPGQNLVNTYEPGAIGNEIKCSYSAGNVHIPTPISFNLTRLIGSALTNTQGVRSVKTGSFEVQYDAAYDVLNEIKGDLVNFDLNRQFTS